MLFLVLTGVIQFVYCFAVTNFPFNAFIGGCAPCLSLSSLSLSQRVLTTPLRPTPQVRRRSRPIRPPRRTQDPVQPGKQGDLSLAVARTVRAPLLLLPLSVTATDRRSLQSIRRLPLWLTHPALLCVELPRLASPLCNVPRWCVLHSVGVLQLQLALPERHAIAAWSEPLSNGSAQRVLSGEALADQGLAGRVTFVGPAQAFAFGRCSSSGPLSALTSPASTNREVSTDWPPGVHLPSQPSCTPSQRVLPSSLGRAPRTLEDCLDDPQPAPPDHATTSRA